MKFWFFLILAVYLIPAKACEITVQVNEFPPYSYLEGQVWQGSRVVLSARLAAKLGCQVQYLDVPFARALLLMEQGNLDFMFNLTKTVSRNQSMFFLAAHQREVLVLGVLKSYPDWLQLNSVTELMNFPGRIAVTNGSYLGPTFEKLRNDPKYEDKFIHVTDRRAKNELVVKGRAQGVVEERDYLRYAIDNFPDYQNIVITPLVLSDSAVYIAISRKSVLFSRQIEISQAIIELQKAGGWPEIVE